MASFDDELYMAQTNNKESVEEDSRMNFSFTEGDAN